MNLIPGSPQTAVTHAGKIANELTAAFVFADYTSRKSDNTIRTQRAALALFGRYLIEKTTKANPGSAAVKVAGVTITPALLVDEEDLTAAVNVVADSLQGEAEAWRGVSHGLVYGFVLWLQQAGYSIASINNRLAAVKQYADLASKGGVLSPDDLLMIQGVKGYGHTTGKKIDERRPVTRVGNKKAEHTPLTASEANTLKHNHKDTPQGRRDALLMCLLLDHGLRVGEVVLLLVENFDLNAGMMAFYRPKVDKKQTHRLTPDTLTAARRYFQLDAPTNGRLLLASTKGGKLADRAMSVRAINGRVGALGKQAQVWGLSPHDCRHYWATTAARNKTDPFALQEAGGWSSLAMPRRYVDAAVIANEGVKL